MPHITLSKGSTHYELSGPESGRLVVLLHGGTIPMWTWDRQVPALVDAGFRVLRYDMFGKGMSASPSGVYNRDLYRNQLLDLLNALEISTPFCLVGFSFGGATATNFSAHHPERVERLALVAPVVSFASGNWLVRAVRLRVIGAVILRQLVMKKALSRASRLWASAANKGHYSQLFARQMDIDGYEDAFLSFMRSDALEDYSNVYRQVGKMNLPVLLMWGTADEDIPERHIRFVNQAVPQIEYCELPGISHGAVFQAPNEVNVELLRFLGSNKKE